MRHALMFAMAALALGACDGGGDPVEQALRETATANQSASVRETATASAPAPTDQTWVRQAIAHDREAVAMAETALAQSRDPEIRRMAQAVREARIREIAEMQAWNPDAAPGQ